jgi:hypothetical protein
LKSHSLPGPVRPALIGVFDLRHGDPANPTGLVAVPGLSHLWDQGPGWLADWRYAPRRALTGAGFTVAQDEEHIMS